MHHHHKQLQHGESMVVISAVSANIKRTNEGLCFTIITYNTPDLLIIFFFFLFCEVKFNYTQEVESQF